MYWISVQINLKDKVISALVIYTSKHNKETRVSLMPLQSE